MYSLHCPADMMAQTVLGFEIKQLKRLGSERHVNVCCLLGCITESGKFDKAPTTFKSYTNNNNTNNNKLCHFITDLVKNNSF